MPPSGGLRGNERPRTTSSDPSSPAGSPLAGRLGGVKLSLKLDMSWGGVYLRAVSCGDENQHRITAVETNSDNLFGACVSSVPALGQKHCELLQQMRDTAALAACG